MPGESEVQTALATPANAEEYALVADLRAALSRCTGNLTYLSAQRLLWAAFSQQADRNTEVSELLTAHRTHLVPRVTHEDQAALAQQVLMHVMTHGRVGISYRDLAAFFHDNLSPVGRPIPLSPIVEFLVTGGELEERGDRLVASDASRVAPQSLLEALVRHAADAGANGVQPSELVAVYEAERGACDMSFSDVVYQLLTMRWLRQRRDRRLFANTQPTAVHESSSVAGAGLGQALARIGRIAGAVEDGHDNAEIVEFSFPADHSSGSLDEFRKRLRRSITSLALEASGTSSDGQRVSVVVALGTQ